MQKTKISITVKKFIIEKKEENNLLNNTHLVNLVFTHYNLKISRSSVSKIIKNKEIYKALPSNNSFRIRDSNILKIENSLYEWIIKNQTNRLVLTDNIIKLKAESIALKNNLLNFSYSNGSLFRFKKRFNLKSYKRCGEADITNLDNCLDLIHIIKKK